MIIKEITVNKPCLLKAAAGGMKWAVVDDFQDDPYQPFFYALFAAKHEAELMVDRWLACKCKVKIIQLTD